MDWNIQQIFHLILHVTRILVPIATGCLEHDYIIYPETFTWPGTTSTDEWIPSNCLDGKNQLIFRKCTADDEWIPDNNDFQLSCKLKMNEDEHRLCPPDYSWEIRKVNEENNGRPLCYNYDFTVNVYCSVGHISFTELTIEEREQLLSEIYYSFADQVTLKHGGSIQWNWKDVYTIMDYKNGEVHLQDARCGRFGMPLTFNNEVPVYCPESECDEMCLSLNVTKEPLSAIVTIEKCSPYELIIFRPLLQQYECPSGYYRMENSYRFSFPHTNRCYSIQIFSTPLPVQDVEKENIKNHCQGEIMTLNHPYDMFLFMQLSQETQLTNGSHCLFGLTTNDIIEYSDWESVDLSEVAYTNYKWDQSMNYSGMLSGVSYLAVNPNGLWTWATDTVSCVVCMLDRNEIVRNESIHLLITYNFLEKLVELEVINEHRLFREKSFDSGFICFAFIGETLVSNLSISPVVHSKIKYFLEDVGLGQYWCHGHSIYTGFVASLKIDTNGTVFAFEITRNCNADCFVSDDDLREFVSNFEEKCTFVRILASAVVHNVTFDRVYTFIVHLALALQDYTIMDLDTNLVNLTLPQVETVYIYEQMNEKLVLSVSDEMHIRSITPTKYCLHKSTMSLDAIIWRVANINETVPTSSLCPHTENDTTRYCASDTIYGAFWNEFLTAPHCYSIVSESLLNLYENFHNSHQDIEDLKTIVEDNVQVLLPIDVFLTSRIIQKVSNVSLDSLANIILIFNCLMMVDEQFLKMSASLNSTNILLEALDNILLSSHITSNFNDDNVVIHSPLIKTFVLDPLIGGVSGVVLYRPYNASAFDYNFTNYSTRYINSNESIDQFFSDWDTDDDLVVGSYLPSDMLNNLQNVSVAIIVFFNDKLFQAYDDHLNNYVKTNGKIISVTIFELDENSRLPSKIPIFFETNRIDNSTCGYWSMKSDIWSSDGCNLRRVNDIQHLALCECTHLTHFGYLVDNYRSRISEMNERVLTIITIIGSSLSLFGALGIFITAASFPNWRVKLSSKILINFTACISLQMTLMIVTNVNSITKHTLTCVTMGSALHYSILSTHFWMLIIAYFQFNRYVVVFNFTVSHVLLKSSIFGWVVPLLPVIVVLVSDYSLYLPANKDEIKFCYPTGSALNYGVLAPVGVIFAIDIIVYISVLVSLKRRFSKSTCVSEASKLNATLSEIRLLTFLFFTIGLTWIFGFLSKVQLNCYLIFTYLFCITATVQGLVLFVYFILMDANVRNLWIKKCFKKDSVLE